MLLTLGIVGVVYVIAIAALVRLWREALRRPPSSTGSAASASKVVPFQRSPAPSAQAETREN
jgi:hypothetical protein